MNQPWLHMYCERSLPGLWEEPLNAITNLAFIVAGVLALQVYRKHCEGNALQAWDLLLLIALLFALGLGSGLWHLVPTGVTVLADVLPIFLFMNVYLLSALHRVIGFRWRGLVLVLVAFLAAHALVALWLPRDFLNGSILYGPGWLALLVISGYLYAIRHSLRARFVAASALFSLSLVFRTVDMALCEWVPIGTHFIWHLLNAGLLYLLLSALVRGETKRRPSVT